MLESLGATVRGMFGPHGPAVSAAALPASYAPGDYSLHLFMQLAAILLVCRAVGWTAKRVFGQPQVVGEMVAGVILGPSLLGLLFPGTMGALFPTETRSLLYAVAQLGVGLYMFLVGTTLDLGHFRNKARSALAVSAAGIGVPFALAALIAPALLAWPDLFTAKVGPGSATLFLGACIALTAFPMLARIIHERGIAGTGIGTLALTAGAFDDACSWCVLAVVLATFGGGPGVAVVAIGGGLLYVAALALFGRRLLAPLAARVEKEGAISPGALAVVLALFCLSAFYTDAIGIHAIFGGFALGVALPRGRLTEEVRAKLEPLTVTLLLPVFFTYSGLNTRLSAVNSLPLLGIAAAILLASILAKFGACWAAARLAGESNRDALGIGALMNARGLMELIIINIGLQRGIIGPTLFAMLVLMAVVTTLMATPLFEWVHGGGTRRSARDRRPIRGRSIT